MGKNISTNVSLSEKPHSHTHKIMSSKNSNNYNNINISNIRESKHASNNNVVKDQYYLLPVNTYSSNNVNQLNNISNNNSSNFNIVVVSPKKVKQNLLYLNNSSKLSLSNNNNNSAVPTFHLKRSSRNSNITNISRSPKSPIPTQTIPQPNFTSINNISNTLFNEVDLNTLKISLFNTNNNIGNSCMFGTQSLKNNSFLKKDFEFRLKKANAFINKAKRNKNLIIKNDIENDTVITANFTDNLYDSNYFNNKEIKCNKDINEAMEKSKKILIDEFQQTSTTNKNYTTKENIINYDIAKTNEVNNNKNVYIKKSKCNNISNNNVISSNQIVKETITNDLSRDTIEKISEEFLSDSQMIFDDKIKISHNKKLEDLPKYVKEANKKAMMIVDNLNKKSKNDDIRNVNKYNTKDTDDNSNFVIKEAIEKDFSTKKLHQISNINSDSNKKNYNSISSASTILKTKNMIQEALRNNKLKEAEKRNNRVNPVHSNSNSNNILNNNHNTLKARTNKSPTSSKIYVLDDLIENEDFQANTNNINNKVTKKLSNSNINPSVEKPSNNLNNNTNKENNLAYNCVSDPSMPIIPIDKIKAIKDWYEKLHDKSQNTNKGRNQVNSLGSNKFNKTPNKTITTNNNILSKSKNEPVRLLKSESSDFSALSKNQAKLFPHNGVYEMINKFKQANKIDINTNNSNLPMIYQINNGIFSKIDNKISSNNNKSKNPNTNLFKKINNNSKIYNKTEVKNRNNNEIAQKTINNTEYETFFHSNIKPLYRSKTINKQYKLSKSITSILRDNNNNNNINNIDTKNERKQTGTSSNNKVRFDKDKDKDIIEFHNKQKDNEINNWKNTNINSVYTKKENKTNEKIILKKDKSSYNKNKIKNCSSNEITDTAEDKTLPYEIRPDIYKKNPKGYNVYDNTKKSTTNIINKITGSPNKSKTVNEINSVVKHNNAQLVRKGTTQSYYEKEIIEKLIIQNRAGLIFSLKKFLRKISIYYQYKKHYFFYKKAVITDINNESDDRSNSTNNLIGFNRQTYNLYNKEIFVNSKDKSKIKKQIVYVKLVKREFEEKIITKLLLMYRNNTKSIDSNQNKYEIVNINDIFPDLNYLTTTDLKNKFPEIEKSFIIYQGSLLIRDKDWMFNENNFINSNNNDLIDPKDKSNFIQRLNSKINEKLDVLKSNEKNDILTAEEKLNAAFNQAIYFTSKDSKEIKLQNNINYNNSHNDTNTLRIVLDGAKYKHNINPNTNINVFTTQPSLYNKEYNLSSNSKNTQQLSSLKNKDSGLHFGIDNNTGVSNNNTNNFHNKRHIISSITQNPSSIYTNNLINFSNDFEDEIQKQNFKSNSIFSRQSISKIVLPDHPSKDYLLDSSYTSAPSYNNSNVVAKNKINSSKNQLCVNTNLKTNKFLDPNSPNKLCISTQKQYLINNKRNAQNKRRSSVAAGMMHFNFNQLNVIKNNFSSFNTDESGNNKSNKDNEYKRHSTSSINFKKDSSGKSSKYKVNENILSSHMSNTEMTGYTKGSKGKIILYIYFKLKYIS